MHPIKTAALLCLASALAFSCAEVPPTIEEVRPPPSELVVDLHPQPMSGDSIARVGGNDLWVTGEVKDDGARVHIEVIDAHYLDRAESTRTPVLDLAEHFTAAEGPGVTVLHAHSPTRTLMFTVRAWAETPDGHTGPPRDHRFCVKD